MVNEVIQSRCEPTETDLAATGTFAQVEKIRVPLTNAEAGVIRYVEETFIDIVDEIRRRPFGHPKVVLRRITALKPLYDNSKLQLRWHVEDREAVYHFPGKNKDEAWRFACITRILSEIHKAIKSGLTVTKRQGSSDFDTLSLTLMERDVFYHEPELFKCQATIDRYIDDIAHTCGVTRADLHVTASPKGLVAGLRPGENDALDTFEMVPDSSAEIERMSLGHIKWILVVEKEATLKTLIENRAHRSNTFGNGLLVTGKGYPDLATRRFLRTCLDHKDCSIEPPPIFGIFDCDPDGINILKIYRYGSRALAQEHAYNIPEMQWLGLGLEDDFLRLEDDKAALPLTPRDRAKAQSMLASQDLEDGDEEGTLLGVEFRRALQHMLMLNRKMEIQILEEREGGTTEWLEKKRAKLTEVRYGGRIGPRGEELVVPRDRREW